MSNLDIEQLAVFVSDDPGSEGLGVGMLVGQVV